MAKNSTELAGLPVLRVAILQRVCPGYRRSLFALLHQCKSLDTRLFIGDDIPDTKIRSASNLQGTGAKHLGTAFWTIGERRVPVHRGLISELRAFRPHVILCEGESHFIGYLQAITYQKIYDPNVALLHWCFIGLPGETAFVRPIAAFVKACARIFFDGFVVYSSYSRRRLMALGISGRKIFVATNVGNVEEFLAAAGRLSMSRGEARSALGLPNRFTVLYAGTLDAVKRPEVMLDIAMMLGRDDYNFVLVGTGPLLGSLRKCVEGSDVANVFLPGRVSEKMVQYYRAADVLLVPGRGGIVISEAMACGVPAIVHQADGTEFDLVINSITGLRVQRGDVKEFAAALEYLRLNPEQHSLMCSEAIRSIRHSFNQGQMAASIGMAIKTSVSVRQGAAII